MEVPSKQKLKKMRTRRNLNELRKKSRTGVKNDGNSINENMDSKIKKISKCGHNEITSKRLTLAMFNKAIKSETVTRVPSTKIYSKHVLHKNEINNLVTNSFKSLSPIRDSTQCKEGCGSNTLTLYSIDTEGTETNEYTPDSVICCRPIFYEHDSLEGFQEFNDNHFFINKSSNPASSSALNSLYKKFMNALPNYIEENFPTFHQPYIDNNVTQMVNRYIKCDNISKGIISCPENFTNTVIQNPMDYIEKGSSWRFSEKLKQDYLDSSNSSSSPQYGSKSLHLSEEDSPEYIYFPHKLHQ